MYCEGVECRSAGDSIKFVLNEDHDDRFIFTLDYDNIGMEIRWLPMSFSFKTDESILDVSLNNIGFYE